MLAFSVLAIVSLLAKGASGANIDFQKNDLISNLYLFIGSYAFPFLVFFLGKNLIESDAGARSVLRVLWALGVYLAILGIVQVAYDPRFLVPKTVVQIHYGRAVGPFGDATALGVVVAVCFLMTLYATFEEPTRMKVALAIPSLSLMGAAIVLSYTRAV